MFQDLMDKAMEFWLNREDIVREPGFHASSGGYCMKRVALETLYPMHKKPLTKETKKVFAIGHMFHDWMDEALRLYCRENGGHLWIQPFRTFTMVEQFKDAFESVIDKPFKPFPLGVFGTPDAILINMETQELVIVDFKTANERAYSYRMKGDRSHPNEVQLGTYLPGIIQGLADAGINLNIEETSIIYIRKSEADMVSHTFKYQLAVSTAITYWRQMAEEFTKVVAARGTYLPPANPPMKWMCNYCSVFDNKTQCNPVLDTESFINGVTKKKELF